MQAMMDSPYASSLPSPGSFAIGSPPGSNPSGTGASPSLSAQQAPHSHPVLLTPGVYSGSTDDVLAPASQPAGSGGQGSFGQHRPPRGGYREALPLKPFPPSPPPPYMPPPAATGQQATTPTQPLAFGYSEHTNPLYGRGSAEGGSLAAPAGALPLPPAGASGTPAHAAGAQHHRRQPSLGQQLSSRRMDLENAGSMAHLRLVESFSFKAAPGALLDSQASFQLDDRQQQPKQQQPASFSSLVPSPPQRRSSWPSHGSGPAPLGHAAARGLSGSGGIPEEAAAPEAVAFAVPADRYGGPAIAAIAEGGQHSPLEALSPRPQAAFKAAQPAPYTPSGALARHGSTASSAGTPAALGEAGWQPVATLFEQQLSGRTSAASAGGRMEGHHQHAPALTDHGAGQLQGLVGGEHGELEQHAQQQHAQLLEGDGEGASWHANAGAAVHEWNPEAVQYEGGAEGYYPEDGAEGGAQYGQHAQAEGQFVEGWGGHGGSEGAAEGGGYAGEYYGEEEQHYQQQGQEGWHQQLGENGYLPHPGWEGDQEAAEQHVEQQQQHAPGLGALPQTPFSAAYDGAVGAATMGMSHGPPPPSAWMTPGTGLPFTPAGSGGGHLPPPPGSAHSPLVALYAKTSPLQHPTPPPRLPTNLPSRARPTTPTAAASASGGSTGAAAAAFSSKIPRPGFPPSSGHQQAAAEAAGAAGAGEESGSLPPPPLLQQPQQQEQQQEPAFAPAGEVPSRIPRPPLGFFGGATGTGLPGFPKPSLIPSAPPAASSSAAAAPGADALPDAPTAASAGATLPAGVAVADGAPALLLPPPLLPGQPAAGSAQAPLPGMPGLFMPPAFGGAPAGMSSSGLPAVAAALGASASGPPLFVPGAATPAVFSPKAAAAPPAPAFPPAVAAAQPEAASAPVSPTKPAAARPEVLKELAATAAKPTGKLPPPPPAVKRIGRKPTRQTSANGRSRSRLLPLLLVTGLLAALLYPEVLVTGITLTATTLHHAAAGATAAGWGKVPARLASSVHSMPSAGVAWLQDSKQLLSCLGTSGLGKHCGHADRHSAADVLEAFHAPQHSIAAAEGAPLTGLLAGWNPAWQRSLGWQRATALHARQLSAKEWEQTLGSVQCDSMERGCVLRRVAVHQARLAGALARSGWHAVARQAGTLVPAAKQALPVALGAVGEVGSRLKAGAPAAKHWAWQRGAAVCALAADSARFGRCAVAHTRDSRAPSGQQQPPATRPGLVRDVSGCWLEHMGHYLEPRYLAALKDVQAAPQPQPRAADTSPATTAVRDALKAFEIPLPRGKDAEPGVFEGSSAPEAAWNASASLEHVPPAGSGAGNASLNTTAEVQAQPLVKPEGPAAREPAANTSVSLPGGAATDKQAANATAAQPDGGAAAAESVKTGAASGGEAEEAAVPADVTEPQSLGGRHQRTVREDVGEEEEAPEAQLGSDEEQADGAAAAELEDEQQLEERPEQGKPASGAGAAALGEEELGMGSETDGEGVGGEHVAPAAEALSEALEALEESLAAVEEEQQQNEAVALDDHKDAPQGEAPADPASKLAEDGDTVAAQLAEPEDVAGGQEAEDYETASEGEEAPAGEPGAVPAAEEDWEEVVEEEAEEPSEVELLDQHEADYLLPEQQQQQQGGEGGGSGMGAEEAPGAGDGATPGSREDSMATKPGLQAVEEEGGAAEGDMSDDGGDRADTEAFPVLAEDEVDVEPAPSMLEEAEEPAQEPRPHGMLRGPEQAKRTVRPRRSRPDEPEEGFLPGKVPSQPGSDEKEEAGIAGVIDEAAKASAQLATTEVEAQHEQAPVGAAAPASISEEAAEELPAADEAPEKVGSAAASRMLEGPQLLDGLDGNGTEEGALRVGLESGVPPSSQPEPLQLEKLTAAPEDLKDQAVAAAVVEELAETARAGLTVDNPEAVKGEEVEGPAATQREEFDEEGLRGVQLPGLGPEAQSNASKPAGIIEEPQGLDRHGTVEVQQLGREESALLADKLVKPVGKPGAPSAARGKLQPLLGWLSAHKLPLLVSLAALAATTAALQLLRNRQRSAPGSEPAAAAAEPLLPGEQLTGEQPAAAAGGQEAASPTQSQHESPRRRKRSTRRVAVVETEEQELTLAMPGPSHQQQQQPSGSLVRRAGAAAAAVEEGEEEDGAATPSHSMATRSRARSMLTSLLGGRKAEEGEEVDQVPRDLQDGGAGPSSRRRAPRRSVAAASLAPVAEEGVQAAAAAASRRRQSTRAAPAVSEEEAGGEEEPQPSRSRLSGRLRTRQVSFGLCIRVSRRFFEE
ncbi:hypothetical protein N2152v2_006246 [Parachlorella kessleri]